MTRLLSGSSFSCVSNLFYLFSYLHKTFEKLVGADMASKLRELGMIKEVA